MVAQARVNDYETTGRKNNCKLNFFLMYFIRNNEEIHLSFKNSENQLTQALNEIQAFSIVGNIVLPMFLGLETTKIYTFQPEGCKNT